MCIYVRSALARESVYVCVVCFHGSIHGSYLVCLMRLRDVFADWLIDEIAVLAILNVVLCFCVLCFFVLYMLCIGHMFCVWS